MKRWLILALAAVVSAPVAASAQDIENEQRWDSTEMEDSDWGDNRYDRDTRSDWHDDFDDRNWGNDPWRSEDLGWRSDEDRLGDHDWRDEDARDTEWRDREMRGTDWRDDMRRGDQRYGGDDRGIRSRREFGQDRGLGDDRRYGDRWGEGSFRYDSDFDMNIGEDDADSFNEWYDEDVSDV